MSCYSPCGASRRARAVVCGARRDDESPVRFCCTATPTPRTRATRRTRIPRARWTPTTNKITTKRKLRRAARDAAAPRVARAPIEIERRSVARRALRARAAIKRARRSLVARPPPRPRAHASKIFFAAKNVMKNSGTSASVRHESPEPSLRRVSRGVPANVLHATDRPHAEQDRRRPRVRQSARRPHRDHRRVVLQRVLVSALHAVELFLLFVSRRGVQRRGTCTPCAFRARATRTAP